MEKLRGLLGIRRMDRVPNTQIREVCGMTRGFVRGEIHRVYYYKPKITF